MTSVHDPILDKFAAALEQTRLRKGYTRSFVAERAGISERFLAAIEKGTKKPSLNTCWNIIRAMGISADAVFYPEIAAKGSNIDEITHLAATCTEEEREFIIQFIQLLKDQHSKEHK